MKNSLKIRNCKQQSYLYYYIVANAGQSTTQYASKLKVIITDYLEWPKIYPGKIRLLIHVY